MLGIYEKRRFGVGEKVWLGRYVHLTNVLHWHPEYELIRIVKGKAQIKVADLVFTAKTGDAFLVDSEVPHYILSEPDTETDIMIFDKSICEEILEAYALHSPLLPSTIPLAVILDKIGHEQSEKGLFYREAVEGLVQAMMIRIFRESKTVERQKESHAYHDLIGKISREFATISFEKAAKYCGYSPSHFSKTFKKLAGVSFSEYLNIVKIENAAFLLQENKTIPITAIASKCGFSSVRNFNRVFKDITGYSPRSLPKDFYVEKGLPALRDIGLDPAGEAAQRA
jgi:AraC-like DNA-binding protein